MKISQTNKNVNLSADIKKGLVWSFESSHIDKISLNKNNEINITSILHHKEHNTYFDILFTEKEFLKIYQIYELLNQKKSQLKAKK